MTSRRQRVLDRRKEIQLQIREIDGIVLLVGEESDLSVKGYLASFAVVRLSGLLEFAMEQMMLGFLEENSTHRVLNFSSASAQRVSNLNPTKLENLVGSFDIKWKEEFHAFLEVDERRQTLGNLIGARHALAHGKSSSVSTSLLRNYHTVAEETIAHLRAYFLPTNGRLTGRQ
jgi:hypothetical protein